MDGPRLALASTRSARSSVRDSVRCAEATGYELVVIDIDGSYVPAGHELVLDPVELGLPLRALHLEAARLDPERMRRAVLEALESALAARFGTAPQPLTAGVLLQRLDAAGQPEIPAPDGSRFLGALAMAEDGRLLVDGEPAARIDLSRLDAERPWILGGEEREPVLLMSQHPALARFVDDAAARRRADDALLEGTSARWDLSMTSLGITVDPPIRWLYGGPSSDVPDPFDPAERERLRTWLTAPIGRGRPARYLEAVLMTRPDLQASFSQVPGADTSAFLAWVEHHARLEGYPGEIVDAALRRTPGLRKPPRPGHPKSGVTVVGYLTGELGIGESARRMVDALAAAGVPHATRAIDLHLASRSRTPGQTATSERFDTTLICVNADLTPAVAATIPDLVRRSYRIGMWYWEVEDFPPSQHGGFAAVDEVWVATDFVRRAIEPHSPVPVRTLTPPLPQRGASPTLTRAELGLPDRPVFLFSFDYLSTAERKNPVGLVDAFERAFRPGEGPVLVIKSINADKRVADAERLRIRAASRPDIVLLEEYLDPAARDALVAHCDCYVSLHRSEGLGLTMAEAMAWGKPVIATGYSGNLQFMNEENSFLVPWAPCAIPSDAAPYPPGGVWADPDLDAAAAFMRLVVDSPEVASARGERAAHDIATLHSAAVAGRAVAARLGELQRVRRARAGGSVARAVRSSVRAAAAAFRDELR